jgi:hypothetical protein
VNTDEFWQIIEESRRGIDPDQNTGNQERQCRNLTALLAALPLDEVVRFRDHFQHRMIQAYDYTLWAAAFLITQGCSDDGFMDFRSWLISMGREVYEKALANPDSLAQVVSRPDVESFFFEELPSIPDQVYEQRTGHEMPDVSEHRPDEPTGARPRRDAEETQRLFPELFALFGALQHPST